VSVLGIIPADLLDTLTKSHTYTQTQLWLWVLCVADIVHMTCRSVGDDAQSDLKPVAELLFGTFPNEDGLFASCSYV